MDKPHALAVGPRLCLLAGILLPLPVRTRGVSCGWQSTPYFIAQQARHGCPMAYIHAYFPSPSTCTTNTQLSSSGAQSLSLQFFFAIALQKALCARQVVCDLKPTNKAPCPRGMLFFFEHLVVSFSNHRAFRPAKKTLHASAKWVLAAASR